MGYSIAVLLQILFGIYGMDGGDNSYKEVIQSDPGLAIELGLDPNCVDCDLDAIKLKIIELEDQEKKAGGITGDDFGAN